MVYDQCWMIFSEQTISMIFLRGSEKPGIIVIALTMTHFDTSQIFPYGQAIGSSEYPAKAETSIFSSDLALISRSMIRAVPVLLISICIYT